MTDYLFTKVTHSDIKIELENYQKKYYFDLRTGFCQ